MAANHTTASTSSSSFAQATAEVSLNPTTGGSTPVARPQLGIRAQRKPARTITPQLGEDSYPIFSDDAARNPSEKRSSIGQVPENEKVPKVLAEGTQDTCALAAEMLASGM